MATHLAKEITTDNISYIAKRLSAIGADAEHEGVKHVSDITVRNYLDLGAIQDARSFFHTRKVLQTVM